MLLLLNFWKCTLINSSKTEHNVHMFTTTASIKYSIHTAQSWHSCHINKLRVHCNSCQTANGTLTGSLTSGSVHSTKSFFSYCTLLPTFLLQYFKFLPLSHCLQRFLIFALQYGSQWLLVRQKWLHTISSHTVQQTILSFKGFLLSSHVLLFVFSFFFWQVNIYFIDEWLSRILL